MLISFLRQMWLNIMYELCLFIKFEEFVFTFLLFELLFYLYFQLLSALIGVDLTV